VLDTGVRAADDGPRYLPWTRPRRVGVNSSLWSKDTFGKRTRGTTSRLPACRLHSPAMGPTPPRKRILPGTPPGEAYPG
jgi:hypothetical protein